MKQGGQPFKKALLFALSTTLFLSKLFKSYGKKSFLAIRVKHPFASTNFKSRGTSPRGLTNRRVSHHTLQNNFLCSQAIGERSPLPSLLEKIHYLSCIFLTKARLFSYLLERSILNLSNSSKRREQFLALFRAYSSNFQKLT